MNAVILVSTDYELRAFADCLDNQIISGSQHINELVAGREDSITAGGSRNFCQVVVKADPSSIQGAGFGITGARRNMEPCAQDVEGAAKYSTALFKEQQQLEYPEVPQLDIFSIEGVRVVHQGMYTVVASLFNGKLGQVVNGHYCSC